MRKTPEHKTPLPVIISSGGDFIFMNIWKGLNHQVPVRRTKDGSPIRNPENAKRPASMSGRQWKRAQRALRAAMKANDKQVAGFLGMGQK